MTSPSEKTVLVVDDEPGVRQYLRAILEDSGFNVETAVDGEEALQTIRANPPDFISLDLVMPRRSGQKLMFELRKDKTLARIPVLIVTAHAKTDLGQEQMAAIENAALTGPGMYLEKPVSPSAYVKCVKHALGIESDDAEAGVAKADLRKELSERMRQADPDSLRRALEALDQQKQSQPNEETRS